jgi:hypothetical protein
VRLEERFVGGLGAGGTRECRFEDIFNDCVAQGG